MRALNGAPQIFLERAKRYRGKRCLLWPFGQTTAGYGTVEVDGRTRFVHRLVRETFLGPTSFARAEAAHFFCGNSSCVNGLHLRWDNHAGNMNDMVIHGTSNRGEDRPLNKLREFEVLEIRERYAAGGITQRELADEYGVSRETISQIITRKRWAWL